MGIFDKAKDTAEELADKAGDLAGKAKDSVGGLADQHGDSVADAVHKGTDFVDDKTGGKIKPVTDKVDELTDKAVNALKSSPPDVPPGE
ncbi:MAG: antitoxin [Candidatus Nanopelagicales bacterium]